MTAEQTNLLPLEKAREFRQGYFLRLGALTGFVLAFLIAAHGALLVPSYIYISEQEGFAKARLDELSASLASSEEEAMSARLSRLTKDASALTAFAASPSAASVIRSVLSVPHAGILLSSFSYSPASAGGDGRLVVSGTASTRESLRAFHAALSGLSFVSNADLPLSSYAKETEIPFTITLTGPLSP